MAKQTRVEGRLMPEVRVLLTADGKMTNDDIVKALTEKFDNFREEMASDEKAFKAKLGSNAYSVRKSLGIESPGGTRKAKAEPAAPTSTDGISPDVYLASIKKVNALVRDSDDPELLQTTIREVAELIQDLGSPKRLLDLLEALKS